MDQDDNNRIWETHPFGPQDAKYWDAYDREIRDKMKSKKGFMLILWNAPEDNLADYVEIVKILEDEPRSPDLQRVKLKAGEDEGGETEPHPEDKKVVDDERDELAKKLAAKFYSHKTRYLRSSSLYVKFCQEKNVVELIQEDRFDLYELLKSTTKGNVRFEVQRLGEFQVEQARVKMGELFGQLTFDDSKAKEKQLEEGIVDARVVNGDLVYYKFPVDGDLLIFFKKFDKLVVDVKLEVPMNQRGTYLISNLHTIT